MDNKAHATLDAIRVKIEHSSGNVAPLLHEIRHALSLLLDRGESTCIDLKSIPLAPGEEERIVAALGKGEVRAEVDAFGMSEIAETEFPGVWVVSHCDENGACQARFIEVTQVPDILRSQNSDIADGLARLTTRLTVDG
jgi:hydrogenase-1 operon protein HyaF